MTSTSSPSVSGGPVSRAAGLSTLPVEKWDALAEAQFDEETTCSCCGMETDPVPERWRGIKTRCSSCRHLCSSRLPCIWKPKVFEGVLNA